MMDGDAADMFSTASICLLSTVTGVRTKPPRSKPSLGQNTPGKNILGQPPHLPRNQIQPLVCNAVVLKVCIMYVHEPLGRNASVNESMYW